MYSSTTSMSYARNIHTSESTEASFLVVFADIGLVVPPHCGAQMCGGADGTLSEENKSEEIN